MHIDFLAGLAILRKAYPASIDIGSVHDMNYELYAVTSQGAVEDSAIQHFCQAAPVRLGII